MKLNCYNVFDNPTAGSHDPSMMWDPVTKKYYSYCTDVYGPPLGLENKIGIPIRSSKDLVNFEYEGIALSEKAIEEGRDNGNFPKTINFWAPYTEYVNGEYRMYYSATKAFGSSESRIWLAVANNPLGPFENRGIVADTWGTDDSYPNAIDPHIIWENKKCYLVYGSFFGGIYLKELDENGMPLDGNPKTLGTCISRKSNPVVIDGPEGASMIYVPETKYFYLFQSYGWLGDDYDIRVGRSRTVFGPFVDKNGKCLVGDSMGLKLANSYKFSALDPEVGRDNPLWEWGGFRGPGHGVPFYDPNRDEYFFVHHIRDGAACECDHDRENNRLNFKKHYMVVRPMFFVDGWPVLGTQPFAGEKLERLSKEDYIGRWEVVFFDDEDNDIKYSRKIELSSDSCLFDHSIIYEGIDFENNRDRIFMTGYDENGVMFWGKFLYN